MEISIDTQKTIQKYIKNKKYISDTGTLKVSFQDTIALIMMLQDEYNRTKDPKIRKAINEIDDERFK